MAVKIIFCCFRNMEVIRIGVSDKIAICIQHLATFCSGFVIAFIYNAEFAGILCVLIPFLIVGGVGMAKVTSLYDFETSVHFKHELVVNRL